MAGTQGGRAREAKQETDAARRMRLLKEQVVRELGLWDKLVSDGWGGLSAKESGRVGGVVARRLREGGEGLHEQAEHRLTAVLHTKQDCSLCEQAKAALSRIARDVPMDVRLAQVDSQDPLAMRVPVVEIEGVEVQAGKVSEFRLRNWLKERGFAHATR